ncbi:PDZ domain-containing protein [Chitinophaga sp. GCM10012297]|uniref:PDZ domain-containing protein n=1 Tax=Chitinophaga chungangae TaxID=2821488 RepID=A0ABS3YD80_9BACT|nr:PDZ domain-containing protein [Chitinophaga chungangae]MBO9152639.1 PDZ domain-containing protein [Chitinophaga chungangae]
MRKILYAFSFGLIAIATTVLPAQAQEKRSGKLGEYDEIVIKRKGGAKDAKVTVEIKDGEVLIDGKKMDEYKNGDIIVQRRRIVPRNGNNFGNGGVQFFNDDEDSDLRITPGSAVLGVITEKKEAAGATVQSVAEGSAADKAGLKEGDVITKVNDKKISEPQDLFETIGALKPGDKITVTYLRDKKEQKTDATLGKRASVTPRSFGLSPEGGDMSPFRFRMPQAPNNRPFDRYFPERAPSLGLSVQDTEEGNGATVTDVKEGSAAEKAGFKKGDLITELAGEPVKNARDMAEAYRGNNGKTTITAKGSRNGAAQNYTIKVPKNLHTENL